eukprot:Nk52_evm2s2256 gene=Nk52_evmTU2s2256
MEFDTDIKAEQKCPVIKNDGNVCGADIKDPITGKCGRHSREYLNTEQRCLKVPLAKIVRNDAVLSRTNKIVFDMDVLVTRCYQFLKLFILHCYKYGHIPSLNQKFIEDCLRVCSRQKTNSTKRSQGVYGQLSSFFEEHYAPTLNDQSPIELPLGNLLSYIAKQILTMYENNIKMHYIEYVERYVNVMLGKCDLQEETQFVKKEGYNVCMDEDNWKAYKASLKEDMRTLCRELKKVKSDILTYYDNSDSYHSDQRYIEFITKTIDDDFVIPYGPFEKNSVKYNVKSEPQKFLKCMIYMMEEVEKRGRKTLSPFPMRTSSIPCHTTIDTTAVVKMFMESSKQRAENMNNMKSKEDEIWNYFFKTEMKWFQKNNGWKFGHMIFTDGVSCSILFEKPYPGCINDCQKKQKFKQASWRLKGTQAWTHCKSCKENEEAPEKYESCYGLKESGEKYVDELSDAMKGELLNYTMVSCDPGKEDLGFFFGGIENNSISKHRSKQGTFRYSQNQRAKETKSRKYRKIQDEVKRSAGVKKLEAVLSQFNKNTLDIEKFKEYLIAKNVYNEQVKSLYTNKLFRKLRLGSYFNRMKSEQRLIRNFEKKFGKPKDTFIVFGDWEQRKQMKFKEPTMGKGFRQIFKKAGYKVFLVDEHRTSKACLSCGNDCFTCLERLSPKPWKQRKGETIKVNGLLRCQICSCVFNRDHQGSVNQYEASLCALQNLERPLKLQRKKSV